MHCSGRWAAVLLVFALLGAACSGGDEEPAPDASPTDDQPDDVLTDADSTPPADTAEPSGDDVGPYADIGVGMAITMARAADPSNRFQTEVVRQLLEQLGYTVNAPSDLELSPADFYDAAGRGEVDLWADARFPDHEPFLDAVIRIEPFVAPEADAADDSGDEAEADDGTDQEDTDDEVVVVQQTPATENTIEILVRDELAIVGAVVPDGGIAGFVTNVSIALENPGLTLDTIVADDDLFARFDAADRFLSPALQPEVADGDETDETEEAADPTDGIIQVLGCPEDDVCADQIDEMIRFARWRGDLAQVHGDYELLVEEALRRIAADQPVILFLRGPSAQMTRLIPGQNVMWLGVEPGSVLDGSITRAWNQRVEDDDGEQLPNPVEAGTCSTDPCHLGWLTNDLAITAHIEFLGRNPAAAALLAAVQIPIADVNAAGARLRYGDLRSLVTDKTPIAASEWIEANRDLVDRWLDAAVSAGG